MAKRLNSKYATPHKGWRRDAEALAKLAQQVTPLLFKQVKTPHGVGLVIGVITDPPFNGLYVEPKRGDGVKVQVWYSTEKAQDGYVGYRFDAQTIIDFNAEAIKEAMQG